MQNRVVMAFRKRLIKRGYTHVSILREKIDGVFTGYYVVNAVEPLGGSAVSVVYSVARMQWDFRF